MTKTLEQQAFEIGYREAERCDYLSAPCRSKEMMDFVSNHSKGIGDSVPLYKAFNAGQAKWFHEDAKHTFSTIH